MHKEHVYIGLGSNLENPTKLVTEAFEAIAGIEDTRVLKTSSLYASKPMGPQDQPDYINAVCLIETALKPHSLLKQLQRIELENGRDRSGRRWGARTLDLDILLYGSQKIKTADLTVPHIGMADREFVMVPLFEIAPSMVMPDGKPISHWVANCSLDGLKRLRTSN
ncbi:2-amino-4-hydroxy-6-hydroxymethyldihydropteridine diphosphokinase [Alteromonas sp. 345S023]|uniref:2-amino-4-hydroxy-6-hydroxymethyldihydropteridine pyrophosphokinase n=1 Tax=Alteromonas profundi TaxID=2696062 RepID=A0A7X5LMV4_9ALTE|nr:2-amino-4-hydroxy-6-hydroxymethyldihydropteridine diphosphokinase [Alteromonas profundi]NDV92241.1 2-amino-4-hydroxy-6-hydroxymethyldihydropteridine diphosphokinase [Alteromonas profundi]